MKNLAYYDGKYGEIEEVFVPFCDRSHFFGDGIYDASYSRNYKIFALSEHLDRFYSSAKLSKITLPYTKEEMTNLIYKMLNLMDEDENFVYIQATRAPSKIRTHSFPESQYAARIWINIFGKKITDLSEKVKLITANDTRYLYCNIKTINLFPAVLASQTAKENDAFETVFHRNGLVTECAHSNIHIIKNNRLISAPQGESTLPGITRNHLISASHRLNIPVEERQFTLKELFSSDEVLITSAGVLGIGVCEIDGVMVGGKAEDILRKLQNELLLDFFNETS